MAIKIGERDRFGYDDNDRPAAAQIGPNVVAFGYTFCARLKAAIEAGFEDGHHLFADRPAALIFLFSPTAQAAELWSGSWVRVQEHGGDYYNITDPQYIGVIARRFSNARSVQEYIISGVPIGTSPRIPDRIWNRSLSYSRFCGGQRTRTAAQDNAAAICNSKS